MMTRAKLKTAMATMADQDNVAGKVAEQFGVPVSTLYAYVDGRGRPKPRGVTLLAPESKASRAARTLESAAS